MNVGLIFFILRPKKNSNKVKITDEFKKAVKNIDLNLGNDKKEITKLEALEELYLKKYINKTQYLRKKKALLD